MITVSCRGLDELHLPNRKPSPVSSLQAYVSSCPLNTLVVKTHCDVRLEMSETALLPLQCFLHRLLCEIQLSVVLFVLVASCSDAFRGSPSSVIRNTGGFPDIVRPVAPVRPARLMLPTQAFYCILCRLLVQRSHVLECFVSFFLFTFPANIYMTLHVSPRLAVWLSPHFLEDSSNVSTRVTSRLGKKSLSPTSYPGPCFILFLAPLPSPPAPFFISLLAACHHALFIHVLFTCLPGAQGFLFALFIVLSSATRRVPGT